MLLSKQQAEDQPGAKPRALVLHVGGDTLHALALLLQGIASNRPMALDLLWQVGSILQSLQSCHVRCHTLKQSTALVVHDADAFACACNLLQC